MAKILLESPVKGISGKVSKSDSSYYANRFGQTILTRIYAPYDGGSSERQMAVRAKFNRVHARVAEILADPEQLNEWTAKFKAQKRYATLRCFVFASIYNSVE
ncbi:MAG: hypothetical protein J6Y82_03890 [Bacteroidales bacterium]|nr:hypothetical protein [Bacteroidales bacterium]